MTTPEPRPNDQEGSDSTPRKGLPSRRTERPPSGNLFWYLMIGVVLAALLTTLAIGSRIGADLLETLTSMFN
ncbi:hypothetical protein, partial [Brasilonema octagenarum]|uniref:hypothetical protein n=1 Tax=Brasilonema octagenarum TaxID=417105 RepID=UPI001B7D015A